MPTYKIKLSRISVKTLKKLPQRVAARIFLHIQDLTVEPRPNGVKKLSGYPYYRIRVGDYRVVYDIQDRELTILVVEIGHRKDIYR